MAVSNVQSKLIGASGTYDGPKSVDALSQSTKTGGVKTQLVSRNPGYVRAYEPQSPQSDEQGYVGMPQVDVPTEMMRMKQAEHAYKSAASLIKVDNELHDSLMRALED